MLISCLEILHICNLWILLRKIVIYLVGRKFHSEFTVGTPECFNIQTRHKFENFCLISSNSTYSIQNQVRYFFSMSITVCFRYKQIPTMTSLPSTSTAKKVREDKIFGRRDILQFFSGVSKDYKYVKSPNMR